jgi:hypothetical protein
VATRGSLPLLLSVVNYNAGALVPYAIRMLMAINTICQRCCVEYRHVPLS